MGQFLFAEHYAGVPFLDAFCELLIQGRLDFVWDPRTAAVRYPEVVESARAQQELALTHHVVPPNAFPVTEDAAVQFDSGSDPRPA